MEKSSSNKYLPKSRAGNFGLALVTLLLAYLMASSAIDTGRWWKYVGTFGLIIFAVNRLVVAIRRK